jgi:hypothetical protein
LGQEDADKKSDQATKQIKWAKDDLKRQMQVLHESMRPTRQPQTRRGVCSKINCVQIPKTDFSEVLKLPKIQAFDLRQ